MVTDAHRITSRRARRGSRLELRREAGDSLGALARDPRLDPVLRERADDELRRRSTTGSLTYVVLAAVLLATASLTWSRYLALGAGTALVAALRLVALRLPAAHWRTLFDAATLALAALWGVMCAAEVQGGDVETTMMLLLCVAGMAAGGTVGLAPVRSLQAGSAILLLTPGVVVLALPPIERDQIGLLLMFLGFLGYLLAMGRAVNAGYWDALAVSRRLELLNADVEAASAAKSGFLADMSHELRTPLTAIRGFSDLLLDGEMPDCDRQYVQTIYRNSDHLLAIINDILDLSRVEAGKLRIDASSVVPGQLALDVEALLAERATAKGLTFAACNDGPIPARIVSDGLRARQIIVNLASNAIRHTERGHVRLTVRMVGADTAAPQLAFAVEDTGVGMDATQLEQLFQPFSQVDLSAARREGGSGLGLAISARLAELLGGSIEIESTVGAGTTATLLLPLGDLAGVPLWTSLRGGEAGPGGGRNRPRVHGRVLVADDDPDIQGVLRGQLERAGATVTIVNDGEAAAEAILSAARAGAPFDVVLMDMRMPRRDGYTTTRQLRAAGYRGAIVAITAQAMAGDRERCLDAGCDDYVSKPFQPTQLLATISRALEEERP